LRLDLQSQHIALRARFVGQTGQLGELKIDPHKDQSGTIGGRLVSTQ
jgi:hypothetical protein